jgi:hypothetical protein
LHQLRRTEIRKEEMKQTIAPSNNRLFLGIECGGTRTVALLVNGNRSVKRIEIGPANLRLLSDLELVRHFRSLHASFPRPTAIAIGMAGARRPQTTTEFHAAPRGWPQGLVTRATISKSLWLLLNFRNYTFKPTPPENERPWSLY